MCLLTDELSIKRWFTINDLKDHLLKQELINIANIHQMLAFNFILKSMVAEFMCFKYYLRDGCTSYE